MALELVTGYRGKLHITAPQDADLYRGLIGDCIIKVGNQMAVEITSPTEVTISDGVCLFDGREFFIEFGDTATAISAVEDGEAYLCICYERDEVNLYETADFQILESYDDRDIRERPDNSQKPFAKLMVENGEIVSAEVLPEVVDPIVTTSKAVAEMLAKSEEAIERMESDIANLEDLIAQTEQAISDAQSATANAVDCADQASEAAEKANEAAEAVEGYDSRLNSVENRVTVLESYHTGDPIAFAIYSEDDGSLTFYQANSLPTGTYRSKAVTEIYTTLEGSGLMYSPAWSSRREDIKKAIFDESFGDVRLTRLNRMFYYCSNLTEVDFTGLNTEEVISADDMFYRCSSLPEIDLSKFGNSQMTDMSYMFGLCSSLKSLDVSSLDTSNVTDMEGMFYECSGISDIDISNFKTSKATNMGWLFYNCTSLKTIYSNDSNFITTAVTYDTYMFRYCDSLVGGNGTKYDSSKTDSSMAHVDTSSNPGYFTAK